MNDIPRFATTVVGSFPYADGSAVCERLVSTLDIPTWPQLSRRTFYENMYVQYTASLPRVVVDEENEKVTFNTVGDLTDDMEAFYARYLEEDVDAFALDRRYATGFFDMLEALKTTRGEWVKGQVTGPISLGLTVTDQDLRASLYHEFLADAIVKNAAMNARWQVRQLKALRPNVILFVDEPYMASFGSAYISLSREQVVTMLDEVFEAIHREGALAGTHCCGNTDWSVLMSTSVDILNLDAYEYLESLALYPAELRNFLDRGGVVAWGIVPNREEIFDVTSEDIAQLMLQGLELIHQKAEARGVNISVEELAGRSIISPVCGLGPTTPDVAERVMDLLPQVGEFLKEG